MLERKDGRSLSQMMPRWIFIMNLFLFWSLFAHSCVSLNLMCPKKCVCRVSPKFITDCASQNLTKIPEKINRETIQLDMSHNHIPELPNDAFRSLMLMRELRLIGNFLRELKPHTFHGLESLQILHLEGNNFSRIPKEALRNLTLLRVLYLDENRIDHIDADAFRGLTNLRQLRLDSNRITSIPVAALNPLRSLQALMIEANSITEIPDYAFQNLSNLDVILLAQNRINHVGDHAFEGLYLVTLVGLERNNLTRVPVSLMYTPDLKHLPLDDNQITNIQDNAFKNNEKIEFLSFKGNPIRSAGKYAFRGLKRLEALTLSDAHEMTEFPDVSDLINVETLILDRASLKTVPLDLCDNLRHLKKLDVHSNRITTIPRLSGCKELTNLNLGNNEISSLERSPFRNLSNLKDLTLGHNVITRLPEDAFIGLNSLLYLDLVHNHITEIHENAFKPLKTLEDLNLGENKFPKLPTAGLEQLVLLKTFNNKYLQDFPPADAFPHIQKMALSYSYHCCEFIRTGTKSRQNEIRIEEDVMWLESKNNTPIHTMHAAKFNESYDISVLSPDTIENLHDPFQQLLLNDNKGTVVIKTPVECKPTPGPFMPCDDLFGWWSLRCGVWVVFLLALVGNGIVLFVSFTSRSKMDVPRFLICNLACADFFMGAYLAFLAIVDASTLGEFKSHAIKWQRSPGCLVAGFLGVLSSELSVFTLTVITLDRFYAIKNAIHLNKRLSLRKAAYIMICGWLFAITIASLPLFEISDYRKFAICLPFETNGIVSLSYVCFVMFFNGLSFLIIVACYLKMYCSIRGSQAWNSHDFRVAKRMALLVFTDLLCWAPIAFLSLSAVFGNELIGLNEAKVFTIFVLPLNSCANPFLYAIFTSQFKKDCANLCKRLEETSVSRQLSRIGNRHVSWGTTRQTPGYGGFLRSDKRGSCSNSMSNGSSIGGVLNYNTDMNAHAHCDYKILPNADGKIAKDQKNVKKERTTEESDKQCGDRRYAEHSTIPVNIVSTAKRNRHSTPDVSRSAEFGPQIILHAEGPERRAKSGYFLQPVYDFDGHVDVMPKRNSSPSIDYLRQDMKPMYTRMSSPLTIERSKTKRHSPQIGLLSKTHKDKSKSARKSSKENRKSYPDILVYFDKKPEPAKQCFPALAPHNNPMLELVKPHCVNLPQYSSKLVDYSGSMPVSRIEEQNYVNVAELLSKRTKSKQGAAGTAEPELTNDACGLLDTEQTVERFKRKEINCDSDICVDSMEDIKKCSVNNFRVQKAAQYCLMESNWVNKHKNSPFKYRSNSLMELAQHIPDDDETLKRHSLTSGYDECLELTDITRDSAFVDDDEDADDNDKLQKRRKLYFRNKNFSAKFFIPTTFHRKHQRIESVDSEEDTETTNLLGLSDMESVSNQKFIRSRQSPSPSPGLRASSTSPFNRNLLVPLSGSDRESGFSSDH